MCNDARDPSSERWNCVGKNVLVILPKWWLQRHLGIFYMPQIYDMGPTALLPLRRKACWGFFRPEKSWRLRPGFNSWTWVLKGSMLTPRPPKPLKEMLHHFVIQKLHLCNIQQNNTLLSRHRIMLWSNKEQRKGNINFLFRHEIHAQNTNK